jgi:hypothetical protein
VHPSKDIHRLYLLYLLAILARATPAARRYNRVAIHTHPYHSTTPTCTHRVIPRPLTRHSSRTLLYPIRPLPPPCTLWTCHPTANPSPRAHRSISFHIRTPILATDSPGRDIISSPAKHDTRHTTLTHISSSGTRLSRSVDTDICAPNTPHIALRDRLGIWDC